MVIESTIRAYQKVLTTHNHLDSTSYSEEFAISRFLKKFEEPSGSASAARSQLCWDEWLETDRNLPSLKGKLLPPKWYVARNEIHRFFASVKWRKDFDMSTGSSFLPTGGRNSLESRLNGTWTVTRESFDAFARTAYTCRALKHMTKHKYASWYQRHDFDMSPAESDSYLFKRFRHRKDFRFEIFKWKLSRIVVFTHGSRFATVPKNNTNDRPINIETVGNIIVQKQIGNSIRDQLKTLWGIDLNHLQNKHRRMISDLTRATIDLKNASDSISLDLVEFLLPQSVFTKLDRARSAFVYGPDGLYYHTKKISSMGNGFTFELMTLILTAICRAYDPASSVYGDDIIIRAADATALCDDLRRVGLVVNLEKSFIDGPFRESCGGNFHKDEGYIKSFDFKWPISIHDCQVILAKCYYLSDYPNFQKLYERLCRVTPPVLQGGKCESFRQSSLFDLVGKDTSREDNEAFPPFFVTGNNRSGIRKHAKVVDSLLKLQYNPSDWKVACGFTFVKELNSPTKRHLRSYDRGKYFSYLSAGRRCDDSISGRGKWVRTYTLTNGNTYFLVKPLVKVVRTQSCYIH